MSSPNNPIRLFVTHAWIENDDYARVFEYLEAPGTFYYRNTSQPDVKRPIDKESQREDLRRQIAPVEAQLSATQYTIATLLGLYPEQRAA